MTWQPPDEVRFPRSIPGGVIFFVIAGSISAGLGFSEAGLFYLAALFFAFALFAWAMVPRSCTLRFHPDCIEHRQSGVRLPHEEITYLRFSNRPALDVVTAASANELHIGHRHGCWRLPKRAPVALLSVYYYLLRKSRLLEPPTKFPGQLQMVYERELADFGAGQVLATTGRAIAPGEVPQVRPFFYLLFILLAATLAAWALKANEGIAIGLGVLTGSMLVLTFVLSLALAGQRSALRTLRRACGIVISPRGLTMESPALKGVITWAEVRGVTVVNRNNALVSGLMLKIEGGQFLIGDHYTCPLTEIRQRITANLEHEKN